MANQDFLDDWAIDRVMREEYGGGVSTGTAKGLQPQFFLLFCVLSFDTTDHCFIASVKL